jgi:hypothetical protein
MKRAFHRVGLKVERGVDKVNGALAHLSAKEKQLHNHIAGKIRAKYTIVAVKLTKIRVAVCTALEPILGKRLVYYLNRIVGGMIVLGKKIGRFIIDHAGSIAGLAVGILVGVIVLGGISSVRLHIALMNVVVHHEPHPCCSDCRWGGWNCQFTHFQLCQCCHQG